MSAEVTRFHSPPQEFCDDAGCPCGLPRSEDAELAGDEHLAAESGACVAHLVVDCPDCRVPNPAKAYAATDRVLCAHADQDGRGMHWLQPGERCEVYPA